MTHAMQTYQSCRRAAPRIPVTLPIDWRVDGAITHIVSNTVDLSASGVFIHTGEVKQVGTPLVLRIADCSREFHGTVVRTDQQGMGVRLGSVEQSSVTEVQDLILRLRDVEC